MLSWLYWNNKKLYILSYYDCEKYPLSPLKLRFLALIEQYLPNISDPMLNSVHRSFVWFLWLNWCKSTFYPITVPNYSKCWPIMTSIQELPASNCDITMTDCSRMVSVDAFLAQWCWGQWFNEFVKDTSVPCFSGSVEPWNVWQVIMIKAIIPCHARCPWPVNHDITCQTFHGSTDPEKHGTDVSFTNSLNHCPQRYPTTTYVAVGYHEKCTHSANNGYDHIAQVVSIVLFFLTTMVLKSVCEIHVCAKFSIFIMLWYAQVWYWTN